MALLLASVLGFGAAQAAEPRTPPPPEDPELLEFLGSSDPSTDAAAGEGADDGAWLDFLSRTDIARVARGAPPRPAEGRDPGTDHDPAPAPGTPGEDVRHE